jgi:hypothetical protein
MYVNKIIILMMAAVYCVGVKADIPKSRDHADAS